MIWATTLQFVTCNDPALGPSARFNAAGVHLDSVMELLGAHPDAGFCDERVTGWLERAEVVHKLASIVSMYATCIWS